MCLFLFEIVSFAVQYRPMYFRAWEYVLNDGLDGYYVPFKPLLYYSGTVSGDLTDMFNFTRPKKGTVSQIFQVDEYGFRNKIGLLNHPVEAVTIGTSWVGGAHETQKNLVSSLLTNNYKIPTYNYATQPLQHFWEDNRFIKNPPKYVLIIGSEIEFLQNSYIEDLADTKDSHEVRKWSSYKEWESVNASPLNDYHSVAMLLKHFSIVKFYLREAYLTITNSLFSRKTLSAYYGNESLYDSRDDILFFNLGSFDPRVIGPFDKNIAPTVKELLKTQQILKKRGITMIVAVMPSKESLQASQYQKLPIKDKILYHLEDAMDTAGVTHISLLADLSKYVNNSNHLVYFSDDSHWNTYPNTVIAQKMAEKIKYLEEMKDK